MQQEESQLITLLICNILTIIPVNVIPNIDAEGKRRTWNQIPLIEHLNFRLMVKDFTILLVVMNMDNIL